MMPKIDGIKALKTIREMEKKKDIQRGDSVKVIMTTALIETPFITIHLILAAMHMLQNRSI